MPARFTIGLITPRSAAAFHGWTRSWAGPTNSTGPSAPSLFGSRSWCKSIRSEDPPQPRLEYGPVPGRGEPEAEAEVEHHDLTEVDVSAAEHLVHLLRGGDINFSERSE